MGEGGKEGEGEREGDECRADSDGLEVVNRPKEKGVKEGRKKERKKGGREEQEEERKKEREEGKGNRWGLKVLPWSSWRESVQT